MKSSRSTYVSRAKISPRRFIVGLMIPLFLAGSLLSPRLARAADEAPAPRPMIEKLLQNVLTVLRDAKDTKQQKEDKVRQLAYDNIDFNTLGRMSLGAFWRGLTDAQRTEFVEELKKHLTNTYIHAVDSYTDQDISVTGDHAEGDGDWTVQTHIVADKDGKRQEVAKVDYRLRQKDKQWKIIDVVIDNVSLAANSRAQFQEIMTNGGIDGLLKMLKEKNAEGK